MLKGMSWCYINAIVFSIRSTHADCWGSSKKGQIHFPEGRRCSREPSLRRWCGPALAARASMRKEVSAGEGRNPLGQWAGGMVGAAVAT